VERGDEGRGARGEGKRRGVDGKVSHQLPVDESISSGKAEKAIAEMRIGISSPTSAVLFGFVIACWMYLTAVPCDTPSGATET
jgi:hypothetical protein